MLQKAGTTDCHQQAPDVAPHDHDAGEVIRAKVFATQIAAHGGRGGAGGSGTGGIHDWPPVQAVLQAFTGHNAHPAPDCVAEIQDFDASLAFDPMLLSVRE
jgi:hypothetical protein